MPQLIYATAVGEYRSAGWPSVLPVNGKELELKGVSGRQGTMPLEIDYRKWSLRFDASNVDQSAAAINTMPGNAPM